MKMKKLDPNSFFWRVADPGFPRRCEGVGGGGRLWCQPWRRGANLLLPPAFREGNVSTGVCHSFCLRGCIPVSNGEGRGCVSQHAMGQGGVEGVGVGVWGWGL